MELRPGDVIVSFNWDTSAETLAVTSQAGELVDGGGRVLQAFGAGEERLGRPSVFVFEVAGGDGGDVEGLFAEERDAAREMDRGGDEVDRAEVRVEGADVAGAGCALPVGRTASLVRLQ